MSLSQNVKKAFINGGLGIRVLRTPAPLGTGVATFPIFTVTGPVMITLLTGYVTAQLTAVAATLRLQLVSVAGTVGLDNGALASNGIAAGFFLQLPDISTVAPCTWVPTLQALANYTIGAGLGSINLGTSTGNISYIQGGAVISNTGAVQWICFYIPLVDGAQIVPA